LVLRTRNVEMSDHHLCRASGAALRNLLLGQFAAWWCPRRRSTWTPCCRSRRRRWCRCPAQLTRRSRTAHSQHKRSP
jgi:hypothetical protein